MAGFTQFETSDRVLNTRMNAFGNELFSQITKYSTYDLYLKQGNLMNPQKPTGAGTEVIFANVTNVEQLAYTFNYAIPEDLIISKDNRYNLVIPFKQLDANRSFIFRFLYKHEGTTIFDITRNAVTTATGNLTVEFQALNQNIVDITALANTTVTLQIFVKTTSGTDAQISLLVNDVDALGRLSRNEATAIVSANSVLMPDGTTSVSSAIRQLSNPPININPDFKIWQRYNASDATTFTNPTNRYIADRYRFNGTGTVKPVAGGAEITGTINIKYILEDSDFQKLNGKTLTRSWSENNVIQKETFVCNSTTLFDKTITNKVLNFIKIELGEIATPLSPRPYGDELTLCQRYYISKITGRMAQYSANDMYFQTPNPIRMRIAPTIINFNIASVFEGASQSGFNVTTFDISYNTSMAFLALKVAHGLSDGYIIVNGLDAEIY